MKIKTRRFPNENILFAKGQLPIKYCCNICLTQADFLTELKEMFIFICDDCMELPIHKLIRVIKEIEE